MFLSQTNGAKVDVNPRKIIAGAEPEKTNGMLQAFAAAVNAARAAPAASAPAPAAPPAPVENATEPVSVVCTSLVRMLMCM